MPEMRIAGGVFGSGASCDAGSTRLVTLKNYGTPVLDDSGLATGVTRSLEAIQRADRVVLYNSHIQLSGKSDVANPNQTTLYSLNRIGDHGARDGVAEGENSLVLQAGSTLILDSAVIETANFKSIDKDEKNVELDRFPILFFLIPEQYSVYPIRTINQMKYLVQFPAMLICSRVIKRMRMLMHE